MIYELHIENIAVIKNLTLEVGKGFSVMTGETGAGKSIIIDSVNLLLGARSATELIRNGEDHANVSAVFGELSPMTLSELSKLDIYPDEDGQVYISRSISRTGKASARVNGQSVPVATLREAGRLLINIHGQHDNQLLLTPTKHIDFLDSYAKNGELINSYFQLYSELISLRRQLKQMTKSEKDSEELAEILANRINEIDSAKLKAGEEEALLEKRERIRNIEKTARYSKAITEALSSGEGAIEKIREASLAIEALENILPSASKIIERLDFCALELQDISDTAESLVDDDIADPETALDKIEDRLELINRLEARYGETVSDVLETRKKSAEELDNLKNRDQNADALRKEMNKKIKEATSLAEQITSCRKEYASRLSELVTEQLIYLDLEKAVFKVNVKAHVNDEGVMYMSANGCDDVEFLISTNTGEPPKPLSKVASGGELSRVMLALKSVLSDSDGVGTIIFDEIDTGVSGKTSQKIGFKLSELSKSCQVICITHSAQIAAVADTQYKISKSEVDGRMQTSLSELDYEERIGELSRIMGGIEITEQIKSTAKEMLDFAKKRSGADMQ